MEDVDQTLIPELRKLCKGKFDLQTALDAANELKYNKRIKELLLKQMGEPENGFVEYFFRVVNPGRVATSKAKEQFAAYVKRAFNEFIEERIDQRLKNALAATLKKEGATEAEAVAVAAAAPAEEQNKIKTTDNEMQAYYVVKSLLIGTVESRRVTMRDAQSYCSVLLDDNNRKPIVRLHFNNPERLRIEIITPNRGPSSWYEIKKLDDILQYAAQLREIARSYDAKPADKPELLEPVSDPPAATITLE